MDGGANYVSDCPKCKHTMERLASYNSIRRNEGYAIDDGQDNGNVFVYFVFGWIGVLIRFLIREALVPMLNKLRGEQKQSKYDAILKVFPNSMICPHCKHLVRTK